MADMIVLAVFGGFVVFIALFIIKLLLLETRVEYKFNNGPSLSVSLIKAIYRIITRRQGKLYFNSEDGKKHEGKTKIPADNTERVVFKNCRIDEEKLNEYKLVCSDQTEVPLCYLESMFMPSLIILATGSSFKLSPLSLIHIRQTIKVHHPLDKLKDETFEMDCKVIEYKIVEKGIEVDIHLSVIDKTGFCIWEGVVTLLSRNSASQKSGESKKEMKTSTETNSVEIEQGLNVKGTTGIEYAQATGDWNPHHLYPWSAKLVGYRQPIAHGMWTLAKMLSIIQSEKIINTYPVCIEAAFKRPLFMPGDAVFKYCLPSPDKIEFSVIEKETSAPHLIGSLTY